MANLVMDFIHAGEAALPTAGTVLGGIATAPLEALDAVSGVGGTALNVAGAAAGGDIGKAIQNKLKGRSATSGLGEQTLSSAVGQGVGNAVGAAAEGVIPEGAGAVQKVLSGAVKGSAVGATASTASGAATGQRGKDLAMDFLQGAAAGGVVGAGVPAIKAGVSSANTSVQNIATPRATLHDQQVLQDYSDHLVGANPAKGQELTNLISEARAVGAKHGIDLTNGTVESQIEGANSILDQIGQQRSMALQTGAVGRNVLDDDTAGKLAKTDNEASIQKQLTDSVGPIVANDVAPAVASTDDPNVVHNVVNNDVAGKVAPAIPELTVMNQPLPSPADIGPITSVSDVNTPQQVAGQGTAAEESFISAPGEAPTKTTVGKLGVMSDMSNMLQSGSTTDEALNHYFSQVPDSSRAEAQGALDQVINSKGFDKSKLNSSLNSQYNDVNFPPVKEGNDTAAILNGKYAGEQVGKNGAAALEKLQALNDHDQELTRYLKGHNVEDVIAQADDKGAFRSAANALKQYNDYTQAAGAKLGQDIPYRQDYGLRTPYNPPETPPGTPGAVNPENPSYTKQRIYQTHEEALANGETPKYASAVEDLRADINQRSYNQTQLALANAFEQAHPGEVKYLNDTTPIPRGYQQLLIPGGDHLALPNAIAEKINNQVVTKTPGSVLGKYDTINQSGKALELGGGTFHGFNTIGTFVGQQLASGKALTDLGSTAKVVQNAFSDKAMDSYLDDMSKTPSGGVDENHSVIDGASATGLNISKTSQDIVNPGEKGLASKVIGLPGLKQIHAAVFDRQIPTMMLETFRQKTQGLDIFGNADDREQGIKIAKQINREFGVIDHDIDGLTQQQFKIAGRVMLAPGYQEGVIRTLGDALTKGGAEGKLAREAVFGKALLFGGLATAGSALGGNFKDQTPKQIALAIMNKAINPSFDIGGYKVSTPATNISDLAKPVEESIASAKAGKGVSAGVTDFANSHLAFLPSKVSEVAGNKNYEGNPIYGTDYFGRPISAGTTAENLVSGIAPIPLAQTAQTATGNQSMGAAIANTVGFNAQPTGSTAYAPIAAQTYLQKLQATPGVPKAELQADTQFVEALGNVNTSRSKALAKAEAAYIAKDRTGTEAAMAAYNNQIAKALQPWEQSGGDKYLTSSLLAVLRSQMISYKDVGKNAYYEEETNPTAYGVPIAALASAPQPAGVSQAELSNLTTTRI